MHALANGAYKTEVKVPRYEEIQLDVQVAFASGN
jgi:hypothetical protein